MGGVFLGKYKNRKKTRRK